jgi:hypothetical protein
MAGPHEHVVSHHCGATARGSLLPGSRQDPLVFEAIFSAKAGAAFRSIKGRAAARCAICSTIVERFALRWQSATNPDDAAILRGAHALFGFGARIAGAARAFVRRCGRRPLAHQAAFDRGRISLVVSNEYSRSDFATPSVANSGQFDRQSQAAYTPSVQLTLQHPLLCGLGAGIARADRRRADVRRDIAGPRRDATVCTLLKVLLDQ